MEKNEVPLVSIGLPVFNGGGFLRRALDSLLAQSFTNFELIISDNASTDKTREICEEYAARDARLRYIRQERNLGGLENFNFVLREAHSRYFMWAAVDDQWAPEFIQDLLHGLENDRTAVGAFCPYQLVAEETGEVLTGLWICNYESRHVFLRLIKFTRHYRDTCIYGLLRRAYLDNIRFKPWSWPNASTPYNLVYPMIYSLLSKGNFLSVGVKPLWFKNVTVSHWHATPFMSSPLLGYLAHLIRKINLLLRSVGYIFRDSRSVWLGILMFPVLLARCFVDCLFPVYAAIRIWLSGKKISQLSPHEIWRLGVR
jgi:glycosyltransferase involved in cell wall biosynthesis